MSIHRGLHLGYNIIMFIRVFYWLIKVDVINCCLIHSATENIEREYENQRTQSALLFLPSPDTLGRRLLTDR